MKRRHLRVTPRLLRMLVLLENGPMYGRQFAMVAPDLFFASDGVGSDGSMLSNASAPLANIYTSLKRAERAGLIEALPDFNPPRAEDESEPGRQRRYYALTPDGRKTLEETRALLGA